MIIEIQLPLPFKLPIEEGFTTVSCYPFADFATTFESYASSVCIDNYPPMKNLYTIMKMKVALPKDKTEGIPIDTIMRDTAKTSLAYANRFLDAFRIAFSANHIQNFTIADLPPTLNMAVDGVPHLYIGQPLQLQQKEEVIAVEGIGRVMKTMMSWDQYPEIVLVERFFRSALSKLYHEHFLDAVIDLQTSFEIYIRNSLRLILRKNGAPECEVAKTASIPFRNAFESKLANLLRTNFHFNSPGPINDWFRHLYTLRNQIVHNGRAGVSGDEAYLAYDAYIGARGLIDGHLLTQGYIDSDAKVDLRLFRKNIPENIDQKLLLARLEALGVQTSGQEIKVV